MKKITFLSAILLLISCGTQQKNNNPETLSKNSEIRAGNVGYIAQDVGAYVSIYESGNLVFKTGGEIDVEDSDGETVRNGEVLVIVNQRVKKTRL